MGQPCIFAVAFDLEALLLGLEILGAHCNGGILLDVVALLLAALDLLGQDCQAFGVEGIGRIEELDVGLVQRCQRDGFELEAVIPSSEYIDVTVHAHEKGLRFEQGRLVGVLDPGRYKLWTHPEARTQIVNVDMRRTEVTIAGQELMTRDKVTLRLTLTVEYAIDDPVLATQKLANLRDSLYLAVQLAARDYVAGVTLDQLLEGRDALTRYLELDVVPKAARFGARVERVGVKDVVLPGEMKTLLNRVIEAEKAAAANVILCREDAAATRNMAQTAKVIAENPVLMRLKELETMKDIAEKIDEIKLVMGMDGLANLLPLAGGKVYN